MSWFTVLGAAGPFLFWPADDYQRALLHFALFGSELGCRLGDD
jgi:hypothetical protein